MSFKLWQNFSCGASMTGPMHIKNGTVNQDAFLIVKKQKYMLFVVSDGMGSKKFADVGSKNACRAVQLEIENFVKNRNAPFPVTQLFTNIIDRWKQLLLPYEARDCSATCLFVFATKSKILAARLGDGMICLLGKDATDSTVLADDKGDAFSNTTLSLSDPAAAAEFKYALYDRAAFKGTVLSTDGISADMENGKELAFAEAIHDELAKMHFWRRNAFIRNMMRDWPVPHHTDDKTLIVAGL